MKQPLAADADEHDDIEASGRIDDEARESLKPIRDHLDVVEAELKLREEGIEINNHEKRIIKLERALNILTVTLEKMRAHVGYPAGANKCVTCDGTGFYPQPGSSDADCPTCEGRGLV